MKKNFSSVDRLILNSKFSTTGVGYPINNCFVFFLYFMDRKQIVKIEKSISSINCTTSSSILPRGHLSPLLLILFINDL